jgi:Dolichyl-phosphate-mannose-protein mannosyltransferase
MTTVAGHSRSEARSGPGPFWIGLAVIAVGALAIRLGYVLAGWGNDASSDGLFYVLAADVLADGGGFVNPWDGLPTAAHPPAWPVLLALPSAVGLDSLLPHQVFACVVGTATVVLVGLTGRVIVGGRSGLLAAAIAAAYPNLWVRERELAAETLMFPLVALVLTLAYRYWRAPRTATLLGLGAACGVLVLVHSAMALLLALLIPALALGARVEGSVARRWARLAAALGVAGAVLLPWVVRNTFRFERPVLLTTNLGLTLRAANCPGAYEGETLGYFDLDIVRPVALVAPGGCAWNAGSGDESERDAVHRDQAVAYIREHVERLPAVVAAREGRTWGLFRPFQQPTLEQADGHGPLAVYRAGVFAYWALVPFAVVGAVHVRRRGLPLFPLLALLVAVVVAVGLTFGSVRYRAPAEVPIVVLAAVGVDATWRWLCVRAPSATRKASTTSSASFAVSSV